jgi:Tfp pilus assembly protein PilF/O-antigen ligase
VSAERDETSRERLLHDLVSFFLCLYACALPWDLFQRVPVGNLTLTKIAALGVVVMAVFSVVVRRRITMRWGMLESAVALFAIACVASYSHSADPAATRSRLVLYATYALYLFAAIEVVRCPRDTRWPVTCFVVSAGCLGIYTLGCYFGWLWPAFWGAAFWPQQRLILEYASGVPLRMAAASADFNGGSMFLVTAFGAALFLYSGRIRTPRVRITMYVLKAAMVAAMAIAMSRSALLLCTALIALRLSLNLRRRAGLWVVVAVVVVAAAALIATQSTFGQALIHRLAGGFTYDEPSLRGRKQVYLLALQLLREYGVTGCGLGAIDAVLAQPGNVDIAVMTVHSMPLALWIELGILGIAGWGLLWLAALWGGIVYVRQTANTEDRGLGAAFLAMCFSVFGMTLVQPFATSPLYPLVLCLCFGPLRGHAQARSGRPSGVPVRRPTAAIAIACTVCWLVVVVNTAAYQTTADKTLQYATAIDKGLYSERYGDWEKASDAYAAAVTIGLSLAEKSFYNEAADVVDVAPLLASLGVFEERANPYAAAQYALGNSLLARGHVVEAEKAFSSAWQADPRFGRVKFDLAETFWRMGQYQRSIALYEDAARFETKPPTPIDVRNLTRLETRIDELRASELATPNRRLTGFFRAYLHNPKVERFEWPYARRMDDLKNRLHALESASGEAEMLERAIILRRLGRWNESLTVFDQVLSTYPNSAEALFNLGVKAEIGAQNATALDYYRQAVDSMPEHQAARQAIVRLSQSPISNTSKTL